MLENFGRSPSLGCGVLLNKTEQILILCGEPNRFLPDFLPAEQKKRYKLRSLDSAGGGGGVDGGKEGRREKGPGGGKAQHGGGGDEREVCVFMKGVIFGVRPLCRIEFRLYSVPTVVLCFSLPATSCGCCSVAAVAATAADADYVDDYVVCLLPMVALVYLLAVGCYSLFACRGLGLVCLAKSSPY